MPARALRRALLPLRPRLRRRSLSAALRRLRPDLVYPTTRAALDIAGKETEIPVVRPPDWPKTPALDLITLAPHRPDLAGRLPAHPRPGPGPFPEAQDETVVVAYRVSERSPGRYLAAAFRRIGLRVVETDRLDWPTLGSPLGVVVVESPLPALPVSGSNPGVPVVFWVHHGEHHLPANLRLRRRYGAHLVALAHSWHLAHRFDVAVDRLPFAVAPELYGPLPSYGERRYDLAFVGSNIEKGGPHDRRRQVLAAARATLGRERVVAAEGISPEELARLYADARIVINEGGTRHLPITMRVFEATGAGALLVSDPVPGLDLLFEPHREFVPLAEPVGPLLRELLGSSRAAEVAAAGYARALTDHTYDRRAAQLVDTFHDLRRRLPEVPPDRPAADPLLEALRSEVDAQRILVVGPVPDDPALADRELWELAAVGDRLAPRSFDTVLVTGPSPHLTRAVAAARRSLYATDATKGLLLAALPGPVGIEEVPGGIVATVGTSGYRTIPS